MNKLNIQRFAPSYMDLPIVVLWHDEGYENLRPSSINLKVAEIKGVEDATLGSGNGYDITITSANNWEGYIANYPDGASCETSKWQLIAHDISSQYFVDFFAIHAYGLALSLTYIPQEKKTFEGDDISQTCIDLNNFSEYIFKTQQKINELEFKLKKLSQKVFLVDMNHDYGAYFEEGMTWGEFIDSDYNHDNFYSIVEYYDLGGYAVAVTTGYYGVKVLSATRKSTIEEVRALPIVDTIYVTADQGAS